MFSQSDEDHHDHLKRVFLKCRKFGLSLNPKKSLFDMKEGKILGNIVLAKGVRIDPRRVEAIQTLSPLDPRKKFSPSWEKIMF